VGEHPRLCTIAILTVHQHRHGGRPDIPVLTDIDVLSSTSISGCIDRSEMMPVPENNQG